MDSQAYSSIRWLLQELSDPFAIIPLQDIARSLRDAIAESQETFNERGGPYGVARKYWDVPMELLDNGIGVAIGSAFVLGQAAIEQSISIVRQIRKLSNSPAIPVLKRVIFETEAQLSPNTKLSNIVIIDTAANYFKHYHGWTEDWHAGVSGPPVQRQTMEDARCLGMSGLDLTTNMHRALSALALGTHEVFTVPMSVHDWREKLAAKYSAVLGIDIE